MRPLHRHTQRRAHKNSRQKGNENRVGEGGQKTKQLQHCANATLATLDLPLPAALKV